MANGQQEWNPSLVYRPRRTENQEPTMLERYGERNILSFLRTYMPHQRPGHEFGPTVEAAARVAEKLALFDENELLLDQVIFGIAYPELCHAGLRDIAQDRELTTLLLVRHFKKFGGLVLPPLGEVRDLQKAHERVVRAGLAAGRVPSPMVYPIWRDRQNTAPSSRGTGRGNANRGGRGGGFAGRGGFGRG
ncbi:hypothetical protein BDW02DRAFT_650011 [Decorospora gaudefroyi]|uniref:Uncharacterized protein n=1 Tax=Decorospora gaudefroyi TaxID=184978 RepID=A0A6A5K399_9PLEO|nr:hypothetical protein BDW02DRAFT_650011 [Decorospora gaudefroyi]